VPDYSGQSIGRYHLIEPLGQGGMATVYRAYDTHLECEVAVKFIRMERLSPEEAEKTLKRFEREAKELARLTHPNIVKVTDYGDYKGTPYLVMPYLPGGTLKQMAGKPVLYTQAARLLAPVARALEYAHEEKLIHRDIKPGNILLTRKGQPMVADFGIAKILDAESGATLTSTNVAIGTPEYMAPEQWLNQISPQTDIYSLGIVFYELVTGRKPYIADTPAAVFLKQSNDPLPRPRDYVTDLPEEVEKVLYKALAKKLEDRYADMGQFAAALEGLTLPVIPALAVPESGRILETVYAPPPSIPVEPGAASTVLAPPAPASPQPVEVTPAESAPAAEPAMPQVEPLPSVSGRKQSSSLWWMWLVGFVGLAIVVALGVVFWGKGISLAVPNPVAVVAQATNTLVWPTAMPTRTPISTLTPFPSPTFLLTTTIIPTLMPTTIPVPPVMADTLTGVRIVGKVDFNSNFAANWYKYNLASGSVQSDGTFMMIGQPGWMSGLVRTRHYTVGQGILLSYRFNGKNECSFTLDTGTWKTDGYRNFGVYACSLTKADLTFGKNDLGFNYLTGNFTVKPDTWYALMMAIAPGGDFKALIWDPAKPSNQIYYREKLGSGWDGLQWNFTAKSGIDKMTLQLKDFTEFFFLGIK
jgi:serine/threonine-protein kinase